ncbi:MAG: hypothetical protein J6W23_05865 [Victivallales bacterium]|nr:hypothetical protein [Victivallales bacterium]MBO7534842.1 hypothetical protein [Victivallales bacterium]
MPFRPQEIRKVWGQLLGRQRGLREPSSQHWIIHASAFLEKTVMMIYDVCPNISIINWQDDFDSMDGNARRISVLTLPNLFSPEDCILVILSLYLMTTSWFAHQTT